ncbi:MAG: MerR family transcriptional regulator [Betaproteobacteria bacterium]|nr:MAG: MerR family transcriptional regulator [Betaproteobacteria bacterium]
MTEVIKVAVLEDAALTVDELACACSVSTEWVIRHVEEGALECRGESESTWRFSSRDLGRARRIRDLERHFDAAPELAALVADMLEELDALRARLRRAGLM